MEEEEGNDNYIYDFKGISLDLESLRLPLQIQTHPCHGDDDDDDEDEWNPPSPPPYNVKDRLIELNRELLKDPNWTEREASRLKWRSNLEEIKWFNKSTDTYSEGYVSSSSEDEGEYMEELDPYLNGEYRVSPTLLANIPSDSSSESSSSIVVIDKQKMLNNHFYMSGVSFTYHQKFDNDEKQFEECSLPKEEEDINDYTCSPPNSSRSLPDEVEEINTFTSSPPKESKESIILTPTSTSPVFITHEVSKVSLSDIQIDLPIQEQDNFFDRVHSGNRREEDSIPPSKNISNMDLKHKKKRLSKNSFSLTDSIEKSSNNCHKKINDNANAFAQWKLKKKHEKLLSERLNYLKLHKKLTSCQRR